MARGIERISSIGFDPIEQGRSRFRATDAKGNGGLAKETLYPAVEIRRANLEKDAEAIAELFDQAAEHLAYVATKNTGGRDIDRLRANIKNIKKYIPEMPKDVTEEALLEIGRSIIVARPEEIKDMYSNTDRLELYVAEVGGRVVGTITVEKPGKGGTRRGSVSKMVVSKDVRGRGIATKLLDFADNRMFKELAYTGASAGIIQGVEGDTIPAKVFRKHGYRSTGELDNICFGWDKSAKKFVYRNSYRFEKVVPIAPSPQAV